MTLQQALRKPTTPGEVLQYEYLEPLNLKINDLAEMLNVHRNTVSALVNNNRKLTADMAIKLAKAFNTTIEAKIRQAGRCLIRSRHAIRLPDTGTAHNGICHYAHPLTGKFSNVEPLL